MSPPRTLRPMQQVFGSSTREVQPRQSLCAGAVRTEQEDAERSEAPIELRERRQVRSVRVHRGSRLEPVEGNVWMEESALLRVADGVEPGSPDVVARRSRLLDPPAQRAACRVQLEQEAPSQRVHDGDDVVL